MNGKICFLRQFSALKPPQMSWKTARNLRFTPGFSQKGAWTAPKPPPTKKRIPKKKKNSQNKSAPFNFQWAAREIELMSCSFVVAIPWGQVWVLDIDKSVTLLSHTGTRHRCEKTRRPWKVALAKPPELLTGSILRRNKQRLEGWMLWYALELRGVSKCQQVLFWLDLKDQSAECNQGFIKDRKWRLWQLQLLSWKMLQRGRVDAFSTQSISGFYAGWPWHKEMEGVSKEADKKPEINERHLYTRGGILENSSFFVLAAMHAGLLSDKFHKSDNSLRLRVSLTSWWTTHAGKITWSPGAR